MRTQIDIDFSCIMQEIQNYPHDHECQWHDNREEVPHIPELKYEWILDVAEI